MAKDGRDKGQRFMLEVSRLLSQWVCGTPSSTHYSSLPFRPRETIREPAEGHWLLRGDIRHRPDVHFPFSVECKNVEGWSFDGILEAKKWPVFTWWEQAKSQADQTGSVMPLLIFTRNHRKNYVLMEDALYRWLCPRTTYPHLHVTRGSENLAILLLTDMLSVKAKMPEGPDLEKLLARS